MNAYISKEISIFPLLYYYISKYPTCEGGCGFAWEVEGPGRGTDGKTVLRELCTNKTQRDGEFSGGLRRIHRKQYSSSEGGFYLNEASWDLSLSYTHTPLSLIYLSVLYVPVRRSRYCCVTRCRSRMMLPHSMGPPLVITCGITCCAQREGGEEFSHHTETETS